VAGELRSLGTSGAVPIHCNLVSTTRHAMGAPWKQLHALDGCTPHTHGTQNGVGNTRAWLLGVAAAQVGWANAGAQVGVCLHIRVQADKQRRKRRRQGLHTHRPCAHSSCASLCACDRPRQLAGPGCPLRAGGGVTWRRCHPRPSNRPGTAQGPRGPSSCRWRSAKHSKGEEEGKREREEREGGRERGGRERERQREGGIERGERGRKRESRGCRGEQRSQQGSCAPTQLAVDGRVAPRHTFSCLPLPAPENFEMRRVASRLADTMVFSSTSFTHVTVSEWARHTPVFAKCCWERGTNK
jgi:hypothetical protein